MHSTPSWMLVAALVLPLIGGDAVAGDSAVDRAPDRVEDRIDLAGPPAIERPSARAALSRGDYREAARLFRRIVDEEPGSDYAPDALYWQAFSLYRVGGTDELRAAVRALEEQEERFPDAATRGDAEELLLRIRGQLARRGDAESAERIVAAVGRGSSGGVGGGRGVGGDEETNPDCPDQDDEIRTAALHALMQMDPDRALPVLERVLQRRDECSIELRERAVFMVADSETERAREMLLQVARTDPSLAVREKAVFWLAEVEDPRAIDALEQILDEFDDPALREKALFALGQHESERAGAILRRYALDASQPNDLREKAIFWLAEHESAENVAFLKELFGRLEDPALRERILFSVADAEGEAAVPWLVQVSRDESLPVELRGRALFWAADEGGAVAHPALFEMWDQVDDPEIKRQLLFAYSEMDTPAAVDKLIEIARSDEDVEVRKRALMWLGETDDPRVVELLEEMVTQ